MFVNLRQQITGDAGKRGLSLFFYFTQADKRTSTLDRQIAGGATWDGLLAARPQDSVALAFGTTHVNERVALGQLLHNQAGLLPFQPVQGSEYEVELNYKLRLAPGLSFMPNLQYIHRPGGIASEPDAVVLGMRITLGL